MVIVDESNMLQKNVFHKDFFSKYDEIHKETVDLVTFTEKILNGKLHFLCSDISISKSDALITGYFNFDASSINLVPGSI